MCLYVIFIQHLESFLYNYNFFKSILNGPTALQNLPQFNYSFIAEYLAVFFTPRTMSC